MNWVPLVVLVALSLTSFAQPQTSEPIGCGKQHDDHKPSWSRFIRAIGAREAKAHSWPWQLYLKVATVFGYEICGASLVRVNSEKDESDIAVTAAHCTTAAESNITSNGVVIQITPGFSVIAGSHHVEQAEAGEETRLVEQILQHPDYKNVTRNDIALLKIERPLKFSNTIRPICLPEQVEAIPSTKKSCMAAGWGRINRHDGETAETLMELEVPVHDANTCRNSWGEEYIENQMICSGPLDASAGMCEGDSGGMLACQTDGIWTLYGALSFGPPNEEGNSTKPITCLQKGVPSVFTRVSSYVNWIKENSAKMTSVK